MHTLLIHCTILASTYLLTDAIHCQWKSWSPWSMCSVSCGVGEKIRHRKCDRQRSCHGCKGSYKQRKPCYGTGIASWSRWSVEKSPEKCSTKCKQTLVRKCRWKPSCIGRGKPKCRGDNRRKSKCDCCRCRKRPRCNKEKTERNNKCKKCCKCLPAAFCKLTTETPVQSGKLPDALKPSHYNVEIRPDIYGNDTTRFKFQGWVDIFLTCTKPTDLIVFHHKQLSVGDAVHVYKADTNTELTVSGTSKDDDVDLFTITLAKALAKGDKVMVQMSFYGQIYQDLVGLYLASYPEDGKTKYMVSTQFQATYARKAFPCMDEPGLKATFNISVWRKEPMIAISNMPLYVSETRDNGWVVDHFSKTPVAMPTYLVAMAVAEFDMVETHTKDNKTMIRFFGRPELIDNDFASTASDAVAPMLEYYQEYFDHEYDFPKSDQIAVPAHLAAAMENWGLVTYLEPLLMVDPKYTTTFDLWRAIKVLAHELVHQWIGNTVTISWWDELWIQEGLTTYFESQGVTHVRPEWNLAMYDHAFYIYTCLDNDQSGSSTPLYRPHVGPNYQFQELFSLITYYKGYTVFMMIEHYIFREAPEAFHTSITDFVDQYSYRNYVHEDLLNIFQQNADAAAIAVNVTEVVYTWINQMGYPVVTFKRSMNGRRVHVTQTLFLIEPDKPIDNTNPSPYDYTWEVPLSYYTNKDTAVQYDWLHRNNKTIDLKSPLTADDWIIGNYRHLGFYRVNYDGVSWAAIIKQLKNNHEAIDVLQRGQLLDDAFDLGRALVTDHVHALRLSEYLINEEEYLPWFAFISGILYTDTMISPSGQYGLFKMFVNKISEPVYGKIGWQPKENFLESFLQERIIYLACTYGNVNCITQSVILFDKWMKTPNNLSIVDANYRAPVYCTAIKNAYSSTEWSFLFNQYKTLEHEFERWMVRDALACSSERWILQRYFEMGATSNQSLDSSDYVRVMLAVAQNYPLGHSVAFDYLNQHWENMSPAKSFVLQDIISRYSTSADLQKFENFVSDHPASNDRDESSYDNMRYTIKANIKWRAMNDDQIISWLQQTIA